MARNLKHDDAEIEMLAYSGGKTAIGTSATFEVGNIAKMTKNSTPTVLVVDDEPLIRWSLAESLREHGYHVTEAADGRMAIAAIEMARRPFDVVLLDYRLPDSADLRLLERVRSLAPSSRVIMITAHNSPELTLGATALGAYRVVSKPFEVDMIAALVNEAEAQESTPDTRRR
jgi:DNA-binding NtrC family response regulator